VKFVLVAIIATSAFKFLTQTYKAVGVLFGFPFVVIGYIAAWKQKNAPSKQENEQILEKISTLN